MAPNAYPLEFNSEALKNAPQIKVSAVSKRTWEQLHYVYQKYITGGGRLYYSVLLGRPVMEVDLGQKDWDMVPDLTGIERFSLVVAPKEN